MKTLRATLVVCGIAFFAFMWAPPLFAQLEIGTWVRTPTKTMPESMTMTIEACCGSGRRLTYHIAAGKSDMVIVVESRLDGSESPVVINGKPSGETMAITRLDAHHASTILRMNGQEFGTSKGTLSTDGKTLTVINEVSSSAGGSPVGKYTETWVRK